MHAEIVKCPEMRTVGIGIIFHVGKWKKCMTFDPEGNIVEGCINTKQLVNLHKTANLDFIKWKYVQQKTFNNG